MNATAMLTATNWALGVRLRDEPSGVHHLTIKAGPPADGRTVSEITGLPGDAWVSFVVRDGQLAPITEDMQLRPGDEVLVLAGPGLRGKTDHGIRGTLTAETGPPHRQTRARHRHIADIADSSRYPEPITSAVTALAAASPASGRG